MMYKIGSVSNMSKGGNEMVFDVCVYALIGGLLCLIYAIAEPILDRGIEKYEQEKIAEKKRNI